MAQAGFPFYWLPFVALIGYPIAYLAYVIVDINITPKRRAAIAPMAGLIGAFIAMFVFGFWMPAKAFIEYRELLGKMRSGAMVAITGPLDQHRSFSREESFTVCGRRFAYDPNAIAPGFRGAMPSGSFTSDGLPVRVSYIGDTIVKVDICAMDRAHSCETEVDAK